MSEYKSPVYNVQAIPVEKIKENKTVISITVLLLRK